MTEVYDLTVDSPPPDDKRTKTIQELYQSEVIYVENLRGMVEVRKNYKKHSSSIFFLTKISYF